MTTDYHYHFYSYAECFMRANSKPERIYTYLRTFIEPNLPDLMPNLERGRQMGAEERRRRLGEDYDDIHKMSGLYCLYRGDTLLAVADIVSNAIDRIITIPAHRRQGHATRLINEIKTKMVENGVPLVMSPVAPHIVPLFEKMGWVKIRDRVNRDGSTPYCPAEMQPTFEAGGVVEYDNRRWLMHLLFLQLHLFRSGVPNALEGVRTLAAHLLAN